MSGDTWGPTPAGFVAKPLAQCLADLQAQWLANVDPTADLSPTTPEGQILGIIAQNEADLWELGQAAWNAYNREDVEGAGLDNLGDLAGVPREGPSFTQVFCTLGISAADAPYLPGTLVASVQGNGSLTFSNYVTVTAAMISGSVATSVLFQAQVAGPTGSINPGTLVNITTPVTGWTSITNPKSQSQLGQNTELDDPYAIRQQQEIAADGAATPPATVAALYALLATTYGNAGETGPYSAKYFQNTGPVPLTIGTLVLPPHTFTVVVYDPNALVPVTGPATASPTSGIGSIAATVWQNKPAGIQSTGNTFAVVVDPTLGSQTIYFTTPAGVALSMNATIAIYPGQTWDDGAGGGVKGAIITALVAAAIQPTPSTGLPPVGQFVPGTPVASSQLEGVIMGVPGVFEVQALTFGGPGFAGSPSSTTNTALIPVSPTQVATLVAGGITLTQGVYP